MGFFEIYRLSGPAGSHHKIGLPCEKCGYLDDIDNPGYRLDLHRRVDIRKDRDTEFVPDIGQDDEALLEARTPEGSRGRTICLVIGAFEDERDF